MVGQTAYKFLLSRDATDDVEKERDEELFNVFKSSFLEGTAYHIITSSLTDTVIDFTSLDYFVRTLLF